MKSFQQFCEQAAAVAPVPTSTPVAKPVAKASPKPKVSDPSAGVDKDKYDRWEGDVLNVGKVQKPGRTEVKPGIKGPDPNLPAGAANPNRTRPFTEKEREEYLNSLPPGVRDDMLKGGKTRDHVTDTIGMLGAAAGGVALGAAGLGAAIPAAASRFPLKGPNFPLRGPKPPAQPARYGGYNAAGKPNIPLKGEPGYRPPAPKGPKPGFDNQGNYIGRNYSKGRGMGDRW